MGKIVPKKKFFKSSIYSPKLNVGSHIDNVKNSLEKFIFSNEKEVEHALMKKRIRVVAIVTVLFMIVGSVLSPKGQAEIATFYPTSCLGGWVNPRNAEGELQTTSNADVSAFNKENSAYLLATTSADIYCGGFKGTIEENTKPTKILVSLAWSSGGSETSQHQVVSDSFASSSSEILDSTSTEDISFTLASSTIATSSLIETSSTDDVASSTNVSSSTQMEIVSIATTTETSFVEKVVDIVGGAIDKIFGNESNSTASQETTLPSNVDPQVENIPQENTQPAPVEQVPSPSSEEEVKPTSFLDRAIEVLTSSFVRKVFAEEMPVSIDTITTETSTQQTFSTTSDIQPKEEVLLINEEVSPVIKTKKEEGKEVNLLFEEVTTTDYATTTNSPTITPADVIRTSSSTESATGTSQSTSTESLLDTALTALLGMSDTPSGQGDFLEVLYTFDGVIWNSLGKVNEDSMKYRTFEIPITASTTWSDMEQLQIKVQPVQRIDATPAVYLDGMKVEVLYESPLTHQHPDFVRDTILRDEIIDGMRIVRIVNNDTNEEEVWYMYLDDFVDATSTTLLNDVEYNATTTASSSMMASSSIVSSTTTQKIELVIKMSKDIIASTTVSTSTSTATTTLITATTTEFIRKKNVWLKYEGHIVSPGVAEIAKWEKEKINKVDDAPEEEYELDLLPDFLSDSIKRIKGNFLSMVVVQVERGDSDDLWLYNVETNTQEKISNATTTVAKDFPIGIKDGYLFWLSEDKKTMFAYSPDTKIYISKEVPYFDVTKGERGEIIVSEILWKVIITEHGFAFFSETTGEVFSDENNIVQDAIRKKFKLDEVLNAEIMNKLDFSIEHLKEE